MSAKLEPMSIADFRQAAIDAALAKLGGNEGWSKLDETQRPDAVAAAKRTAAEELDRVLANAKATVTKEVDDWFTENNFVAG